MGKKRCDSYDIEVGRRIRARRIERQMSQTELAYRLGLTFQQVQKYEKGTNRVAVGRLQRIAKILEAPIQYFFDEPDDTQADGAAILESVNSARTLRLVRAYSRIQSKTLQESLLELTEKIAREILPSAGRTQFG